MIVQYSAGSMNNLIAEDDVVTENMSAFGTTFSLGQESLQTIPHSGSKRIEQLSFPIPGIRQVA